jgi:hypothetical protein
LNNSKFTLISIIFFVAFMMVGQTRADDGSGSADYTDYTMETFYHYDQDVGNGFKGWFDLTVTNNTNTTWGDFHFQLFDFGIYNSSVIFVDSSTVGFDPLSTTTTIDSWAISNGGKNLDVFFYGDPVSNSNTLNLKVWTDNTAGTNDPFAIGAYPSVVPEPVSSTLFLVGAATLGFRRLRRNREG